MYIKNIRKSNDNGKTYMEKGRKKQEMNKSNKSSKSKIQPGNGSKHQITTLRNVLKTYPGKQKP